MRRREELPLAKHTLHLYLGDFDKLRDFHGRIGASKVIRSLVRAHIVTVETKAGVAILAELPEPVLTGDDIVK